MKITPDDMDDVRAACNMRTSYHAIDYEARDTALALILEHIYDRAYRDGWVDSASEAIERQYRD